MTYVPVTAEVERQAMLKMGIDEWMANLMGNYSAAYSANWGDLVTDDFQRAIGKLPRSIEQFSKDFAGAFRK